MKEKIAIVVDSGSDIGENLQKEYGIVSLPLRILMDNKEYTDGVDIERDYLFSRLGKTKISTSLPSGEDILNTFENIKEQGYTHAIVVSISSALSGTYNVLNQLSKEVNGLEFFILDTKNISLASGYLAIEASKKVKEGKSFDEVVEHLNDAVSKSKVFFTVGTLDYLVEGGRIGLVAGTIANALNIKPIISCNKEGVYYTHKKIRGYNRVIKGLIDEAYDFVKDTKDFTVTLLNANSQEDLDALKEYAENKFNKKVNFEEITPALVIHTGPEAIGIAVIKY